MIRVQKQPEPRPPGFDFNKQVRQPGLSALAELTGQAPSLTRPGPRIKPRASRVGELTHDDLRDYPYWTRALDALHKAYQGICAYSCFYMEPLCGPTVDHFVALKRAEAAQAYEWDNYRLACSLMNASKNAFPDVLDPFLIHDGWFTLNLGTFKVEVAEGLEEPLKQQVQHTITRLKLDSRDVSNTHRSWFESSWQPKVATQPVPLWFLEQRAPFLVREMRRQGRIRPEDGGAPLPGPQP